MGRIEIGNPSHTEVMIGRGRPRPLLPESVGRQLVAILTQPTVAEIAQSIAAELGSLAHLRTLPDREESKTLQVAEATYTWLAELGLSRHDTIVAVGGGALTDMAGFVAATYLRGIEVVHVPTTLLAAVDASIGGKTAVNVAGKNLVGAFWHPSRVIIDIDVIESLPHALLVEGAAEAIKCGFIADPRIVTLFERSGLAQALEEVVTRAVAVKADIVSRDERESGVRAHLNYGHTVGHGIEFATGIPHGHAVSIGMVAAAAASARVTGYDAVDDQTRILSEIGLPVVAPTVEREHVQTFLSRDKKRDRSGIRMTLLEGPQRPIVVPVDSATVDAALDAVGIS